MDTIPLLPDFLDLLRFLNEDRVEYLVIGGMAVNFYVEIHGGISGVEFRDCYARAEVCDIQGVAARMISLSDLRRNKLAAGRMKDRADLESLPTDTGDSE